MSPQRERDDLIAPHPAAGPRRFLSGSRDVWVWRAAAVAAAAALVTTVAVVAPVEFPEAEPASAAPLAAAPAAASAAVNLPRTARAAGTIAGWSLAGREKIAEVGPEVGSVASGSVALGIDAPVVATPRTAASTVVAVKPATTYTFEARVRLSSKTAKTVAASFVVGGKTITLPALNASWRTVTGSFTTASSATTAEVAVRLSKAVRGLSVDAVKVYALSDSAQTNLVPNGSFEEVTVGRGIASTSLIMTTPTAALAVALPAGKTTWEVLRGTKRVKTGSVTASGALTSLPLVGVSQGYYTIKVRASDRKTVSTKIAVVDSPHAWITPDKRFGVALHVEEKIYADAARHSRALGISEARNDIFWAAVEKRKGHYDFGPYDAAFARLGAQGIRVLGIAGYGNRIYGASNASAPRTSAALKAYGKYAAAVAKRFDLLGLEVYNEFNHAPKNKSNCRTAKCYLSLLSAVDSAVAKVKPKLPIIAGNTARYPASWFDDLWKRGGLKRADAVSFHPYEITGNPEGVTAIVQKARKSMKTHGKMTKPVWISELGTSSRAGNRTTLEQASVLSRTAVASFAGGAKKFYWYDLINDTANKRDQEGNFGLYSHPTKGLPALAPKEAAFAQALTITQLGGRSFRASEKLGAGVVSHAFGSTRDTVRAVWATKGSKTATIKTKSAVVVVNFDGTKKTVKPKKGVVKIKVTTNPVFVRSGSATAGVTK